MPNKQYTLRAVPPEMDQALRRRAKSERKSLNTIILETLAQGLDLNAEPLEYTDLDPLVGSWREDANFDRAVTDFEKIDQEVWK